ncbi:MAG: 2-C-methyl-D-erythritol 4-phosphate cytidylyltransferase [Blastocatellia bacterium]|jgi:2-C-methyl-D-erythritol 4-phosphate cytidylyltransferase|nr:2-C-methyl-D-erythritol 4-phosphate cytidylyltransferase [Blastocatellia bacterium]
MNVAIIAAAGQGVRMGTKRAKQFLELDGIPVIIHTLTRFEQCPDIHEIVVVLPEKDVKRFPALARKYGLSKVVNCVAGGPTRARSVKRGLDSMRGKDVKIVTVHDGVRPFVTPKEISQTVKATRHSGAAILFAPVNDTIKVIQGDWVRRTYPRTELCRALTPQCFRYELLRHAQTRIFPGGMQRSRRVGHGGRIIPGKDFTDDSMLVEEFKKRIFLVAGNPRNIKITGPEDIAFAEIILKRNPEFRIKKPK